MDLDGGVISVPECVKIPSIPEPYYTSTVEVLTKVSYINKLDSKVQGCCFKTQLSLLLF